ncbi:PREDICTED: uncharacterized protein LOC109464373 [Branchiostoma belcheri]|uniref:Uncharacterized protein LOC109464373 n=1 Tax=Branchiostoma belcheri TaxID=7741 RepID=A0A6P4Y366_BRABE|nr:PREDICTED: uncharacterized protein LOC109464373 [Branchiostoma belcheri]
MMDAAFYNFLPTLSTKLYVMKTVAVVLLLLHGTTASPVPAAVQALTNAQTQTRRLYEKVSTAFDAFIQEEFNGDSVYCAEQIFILEELDNIRMTTAEWRQLEVCTRSTTSLETHTHFRVAVQLSKSKVL